ncbi:uncharacterized protein LY89DRAFT_770737 [Mollisia scopiformis]|uniref:Uncharacterized protein n=1 Tax=Mollisia scopiformis TaxID=149040 RepID=A0A194XMR2_MOLSC|nr:uncharacterized protein LY89DRAFT_770737 [Mollisia scopiformis]KUJ21379.1 hypothetical protein LY89DRAFT_770737 [Mollisia scopiformis]
MEYDKEIQAMLEKARADGRLITEAQLHAYRTAAFAAAMSNGKVALGDQAHREADINTWKHFFPGDVDALKAAASDNIAPSSKVPKVPKVSTSNAIEYTEIAQWHMAKAMEASAASIVASQLQADDLAKTRKKYQESAAFATTPAFAKKKSTDNARFANLQAEKRQLRADKEGLEDRVEVLDKEVKELTGNVKMLKNLIVDRDEMIAQLKKDVGQEKAKYHDDIRKLEAVKRATLKRAADAAGVDAPEPKKSKKELMTRAERNAGNTKS